MGKVTFSKFIVRAILIVVFLISFGTIITVAVSDSNSESAWAVVAASLAVIASVVIAYTGQRVLELQQDAQQPYPYPTIDATSRYSVLQLCVKNMGGTPAYAICLEWDDHKPLLNSEGAAVIFTKQQGTLEIPILLPGEAALVPIDEVKRFFSKVEDANYSGCVSFKDASGNSRKHKFYLSAERHRYSLHYEHEEPKTHYKIQEIPGKLNELTDVLRKLERSNGENSSQDQS